MRALKIATTAMLCVVGLFITEASAFDGSRNYITIGACNDIAPRYAYSAGRQAFGIECYARAANDPRVARALE